MRLRVFLFYGIVFFAGLLPLSAQKAVTYMNYIETYKDMAVEQMYRYRIPASITLAQGLLESGAGTSTLARQANNHFGIKVSGNWNGPYMLRDDDYPNEKFRKYNSPRESYEDHSLFLKNNTRYAPLFRLDMYDYKGWAHGLKKAGYATNPQYAQLLINIIELYDLHKYDNSRITRKMDEYARTEMATTGGITHPIGRNNKNYYLIARRGDTFASIAKEVGVSYRKLLRYNEVDKHYVLQEGDIVYLEKKQSKADKMYRNRYHQVQPGESLYFIAQKYGFRLKTLYKVNGFSADHSVQVGDYVRLR